jgi:hypothetical protein
VLGSDELYREWGYTALSRHRDEARFYVSATPAFLNEPRAPLEAGEDVARQVARILETSRAETLALNGVRRDYVGDRLTEDLDRARERLVEIETRLGGLLEEHAQIRWYQRSRRARVERVIDGWQRGRHRCEEEIAWLTGRLEQRPAAHETELRRAGDPLAGFEPRASRELLPGRVRERDLGLER